MFGGDGGNLVVELPYAAELSPNDAEARVERRVGLAQCSQHSWGSEQCASASWSGGNYRRRQSPPG